MGNMTTNEKLSAQVIGELEQENERLREIAADLLAALKRLLGDHPAGLCPGRKPEVLIQAEAAICKAEGRQP